jgi:hypothetical protein
LLIANFRYLISGAYGQLQQVYGTLRTLVSWQRQD